jgi:hypothetical protein
MEVKFIDGKEVRLSSKYPNYGTSCDGEVYRWNTEKRMTISLHGGDVKRGDNYLAFRACHNNRASNVYVHMIVADCWVHNDSPDTKTSVNHIDGCKRNPHYKNLEWVTPSQNQIHTVSTGLKGSCDALYNSELTNDQVHLICQRLVDGHRPKDIAQVFGCSTDIVRKIKAGDTYFNIRVLYNIPHDYKSDLSEETVRWVCEKIQEGMADKVISTVATNKAVTIIEIKRIRYKIRYRIISDEYF